MYLLFYFLAPLLFLNPNFKAASKLNNLLRYLAGFIFFFMQFYNLNKDKSLSFMISVLWIVGAFQIIAALVEAGATLSYRRKVINVGIPRKIIFVSSILILASVFYNNLPFSIANAKGLYNLAAAKESTEDSPKANTENIIIIPPETAYYQMQNLIGSIPNPSYYKIGQMSLTKTSGGAYYVAPVEFSDSIKALLNRENPGVMYVSAERLESPKFVDVKFNHSGSLVFNNYIYREMRKYKQDSVLLNANIELDDDLNPYYVGSYGHYKYGRKGIVVDGVILYELKSGTTKVCSKEETPKWVDQIYTYDVAENYNEYFGLYKSGYINSIIGQKDVHIPTAWKSGTSISGLEIESNQVIPVVGSSGEMYFFTDHTNTSSNSTTMTGYTLMDSRTGEMIYYKTPGSVNGEGAMNVVEKLLGADKANWTTSQPILYNIYGIDTWIIPVINKVDGSFVKLGLVTAESKYGILADNKADLMDSFKKAIASGKVNESSDTKVDSNTEKPSEKEITGKIWRINQTTESGKAVFYVKLENSDKIFMVDIDVNPMVVLARDGDTVTIKYEDMEEQTILSATSFK